MTDDEPINDDPTLNPYEAPHYVEGEPEPLRQFNSIEILFFGVNSLFLVVFTFAFLKIIISPENPDQRFGAILCIVPSIICAALEFAVIFSQLTRARHVLGIADLIFGALLAVIAVWNILTSDSAAFANNPHKAFLNIAIVVGFYFVFCGAYRLYRVKQGAIIPVAAPVEGRESSSPPHSDGGSDEQ